MFDLSVIHDVETLETKVIEDWRPHPVIAGVQQKLVEITVAEWWPGQKVRIPVTLNAPVDTTQLPCRNVIVANMPVRLSASTPGAQAITLLLEKGVGVVLVGMGTIDAMVPVGRLHLGMKEQLLKSKDPRFSTAWIWGVSQMRGLTAAEAESGFFRPEKVISTGGSKRGIATAVAGIHDDRFTGIMPVVAPPLGNPGTPVGILGTEPDWIALLDQRLLETVDPGIRRSLEARNVRRATTRLTLTEVQREGWSKKEIAEINDRLWNAARITDHLKEVNDRKLAFFYTVGTNDSVTPALIDLGRRYPDFPVYIVPGGQHGGPGDAGYTRRVTIQPEVVQNFDSFCRHHFFGGRDLPAVPRIRAIRKGSTLIVTTQFKKETKPEQNRLSWAFNRHQPYTLPFEYDRWESTAMRLEGKHRWQGTIQLPENARSIQFLSTHVEEENGLPFAFSSALQELLLEDEG